MSNNFIKTIVLVVIAILLYFLPGIKLPYLDNNANSYFSEAMEEATIAYGTTQVINASVSVIKESSISLEPAGFGLSIAIGQILDPIDDMTERLADVLITAIASLGIQKVAHEIGVAFIPKIIALIVIVLTALLWVKNDKANKYVDYLSRIILLLLVLRVFLPASSILNDMVYEGYFDSRITQTHDELKIYSKELDKFKDFQFPDSEGIWDTISNSARYLSEKTSQFSDAFMAVVENIDGIVSALVQITWLYLGLFVMQVIVLPLLMFWLLVKFVNSFFDTQLPYIIKHSKITSNKKVSS